MPILTYDEDDRNNVVPFNVPRIVHDACRMGSFEAAHRADLERRRDACERQFQDAACDLADALIAGRAIADRLNTLRYWRECWINAEHALSADRPSDTEGA